MRRLARGLSTFPRVSVAQQTQGVDHRWRPRLAKVGMSGKAARKKGKRQRRSHIGGGNVAASTEASLSTLQEMLQKDSEKALGIACNVVPGHMGWLVEGKSEEKTPEQAGWNIWNALNWYAAANAKRPEDTRFEVALTLCSDKVIAAVNQEFRGKPAGTTTDVISIPARDDDWSGDAPIKMHDFGEMLDPNGGNSDDEGVQMLSDKEFERIIQAAGTEPETKVISFEDFQQLMQADASGEAGEFVPQPIDLSDPDQVRALGLSGEEIKELQATVPVMDPSQLENAEHIYELGDIIISLETAERQANQRGISLVDELRILYLHGLLHVLGFDHSTEEEFQQMALLESKLMNALNWKGAGLCERAN